MTSFGASAPAKDVAAHFGFTAERVAEAARRSLARVRGTIAAANGGGAQ